MRGADLKMPPNWPEGKLSKAEWQELVTLEYILTQGYSENEKVDEDRLKELRLKHGD